VLAVGLRRSARPVAAGLFAFSAVVAFGVFVGAVETWLGWLDDTDDALFGGFDAALLVLALLTAGAAAVAVRTFRFPLLVAILALTLWYFVTDLVSNGGDWSAAVSMIVGVVLLVVGIVLDGGPLRPYGFWVHVAAGLLIGGGLLYFSHESDGDWLVIGIAGLVFIAVAARLARSSWAVLGAFGLLQTTTHFADKWGSGADFFPFLFPLSFFFAEDLDSGDDRYWVAPLLYAALGLAFVTIGLGPAYGRRWRREGGPVEAL
jgi:hypothetical protein